MGQGPYGAWVARMSEFPHAPPKRSIRYVQTKADAERAELMADMERKFPDRWWYKIPGATAYRLGYYVGHISGLFRAVARNQKMCTCEVCNEKSHAQ